MTVTNVIFYIFCTDNWTVTPKEKVLPINYDLLVVYYNSGLYG